LIQTFVTELFSLAKSTIEFTFRNFFVLAAIAGKCSLPDLIDPYRRLQKLSEKLISFFRSNSQGLSSLSLTSNNATHK